MLREPRCSERRCVHLTGVQGEDEFNQRIVCKAFPNGIPDEIAYGDNPHTSPFPGDHGIQYELDPDAPEQENDDEGEG